MPLNLSAALTYVLGAILPTLALACAFGYLVRAQAARWGLVDRADDVHKTHTGPVPLGGGLAIAAAVVLVFALGQSVLILLASPARPMGLELPDWIRIHVSGIMERSPGLWTILGAALVLTILGVLDDRYGLPWIIRLAVQIGVAVFIVWWNDWRLTAFIPWPAVTYALTVIWIVALINAFNMLDNMDGLSAGVATICAAALAAVMLLSPNPEGGGPQIFVAGFLLVLIGALLGFLWHNRPPARLFMGDAGSYFIGFCLAVATIQAAYTGYHSGTPHAVLAPLLIMAVPLYDMASVIFIRLREGRSPFQADRRHFSHRLVALGFSQAQSVLIIYLVTATTALAALVLHQVNGVGAIALSVLVACVLALVAILEQAASRP
jgi:UDP-GlcNAc:undecaprenyl-phosphate GlcNAc-1-phosphate transferase